MTLIVNTLSSNLNDIYESDNHSPDKAATLWANAVTDFWNTANTPGFGTVQANGVNAALKAAITDVYSRNTSLSIQSAVQVANALNTTLAGVIASGGLYGTGPVIPLGLGLLIPDLTDIYSQVQNNGSITANLEAQAIWKFTKNTLCIGTGVGSPPVPQIGPLI